MKGEGNMKKEDVLKKMAAVKTAVESKYPGVKAEVQLKEWEKSGRHGLHIYHRLYINLVIVADVNGKEKVEKADFGFINITTNRYNVKGGYDMRHFDADELTPAKMLYEYAEAYKTADNDKTLYVAKEGFRLTLGLSKTEEEKGISRREMLNKSFEMYILPDNFDTYWKKINSNEEATNEEEIPRKGEKEGEKIGSYDGHTVTISPSTDKCVVKDNGKYTGDYGRDRDDGLYEASMYLYDRMAEGHVITVLDDTAWGYIVENAAGLSVSINTNAEARTIKKEEHENE